MARMIRKKTPWDMYILFIILGVLAIVGLALVIGPKGAMKKAVEKIEAQDKGRLEKPDVFKALEKALYRAKPKSKGWKDLSEEERGKMIQRAYQEMKDKGYQKDIGIRDVKSMMNDLWREKRTEEQPLPSDDPAERWKALVGTKFETIRKINLKDETGFLNCPQVDVYEDPNKAASAGQLNHDEWVVTLEEQGAMTKVKRRKDKKIAWIETKFLRRIYSKEDIEKGPSKKKPQEREE